MLEEQGTKSKLLLKVFSSLFLALLWHIHQIPLQQSPQVGDFPSDASPALHHACEEQRWGSQHGTDCGTPFPNSPSKPPLSILSSSTSLTRWYQEVPPACKPGICTDKLGTVNRRRIIPLWSHFDMQNLYFVPWTTQTSGPSLFLPLNVPCRIWAAGTVHMKPSPAAERAQLDLAAALRSYL